MSDTSRPLPENLPGEATVLRPTPGRLAYELASSAIAVAILEAIFIVLTHSALLIALILVIYIYVAARTVTTTRTVLYRDHVERIFANGQPRRIPVTDIADVEVVREGWRRIVRLRLIDNSTRLLPVPAWSVVVRNPDFDVQATIVTQWWEQVQPPSGPGTPP